MTVAERDAGRVEVRGDVGSLNRRETRDGTRVSGEVRGPGGERTRFAGEGLSEMAVGYQVHLVGYWEPMEWGGRRLRVLDCVEARPPVHQEGIASYLASLVDGIGMQHARRLVAIHGTDTVARLRAEPALAEAALPGRRGRLVAEALRRWAERDEAAPVHARILARLQGAGATARAARAVVQFFRSPYAAEVAVLRDPYRLLEVPYLGWNRVDAMAERLGVPRDAGERAEAAAVAALDVAMRRGHSELPLDALLRGMAALVPDMPQAARQAGVERALTAAGLVEDSGRLLTPDTLEATVIIARAVRALLRRASHWGPRDDDALTVAERTASSAGTPLTPEQRHAVRTALAEPLAVVSGRPGAGKTTVLRALLRAVVRRGEVPLLLAPTGKAASRATHVTGIGAQTIHRALGGAPGMRTATALDADLVIVDEASMCSLQMLAWLLMNIDLRRTRLLLVGDADQLPSVDHGAVLRDLLAEPRIPSARLRTVHRQAERSHILEAANALLDGGPLPASGDDFRVLGGTGGAGDTEPSQETLLRNLERELARLADEPGVVVSRDVQVLSPMRRGPLGVASLNLLLQQRLNPNGRPGPTVAGRVQVRVGDRIIQTRNDYSVEPNGFFNGEQALVTEVGPGRLVARLDDGSMLSLRGVQLLTLQLAWAITVHRSQGSEYPHVILMYDSAAHRTMLSLGLLYTAVTRARSSFLLLGDTEAIRRSRSAEGREADARFTGLPRHLDASLSRVVR